MKNNEFLLAEQIGASGNPLKEISNLRKLLDKLEKIYTRRKQIYDKISAKRVWWKKRWVIRWRSP